MPSHQRLSVHNVTFYGAALAELETHWATLGVSRLSILDSQMLDSDFPKLLQHSAYTVEAVYHLFAGGRLTADPQAARDALLPVIDAAAGVGARMVYLLTGGRDTLTWNQAADRFAAMIAPASRTPGRPASRWPSRMPPACTPTCTSPIPCATPLRWPR